MSSVSGCACSTMRAASTMVAVSRPYICMATGRSSSLMFSFCWVLPTERIKASAETNSVYTMSAPEVLAHQAESRVGDVLHRGEEYGAWAQVYIFNLHNLSGFVRKSTEKSLPLHTLIQKEMMKHSISDFEIMAPVGSRESLAAAIQAGADSIYFGIENLNMRARSANTFTIDDLRK